MQQAFRGPSNEEAAGIIENLHRTIDRAAAAEEDFRREMIIYRVFLLAKRAGAAEAKA
jgi:hypothetical protein